MKIKDVIYYTSFSYNDIERSDSGEWIFTKEESDKSRKSMNERLLELAIMNADYDYDYGVINHRTEREAIINWMNEEFKSNSLEWAVSFSNYKTCAEKLLEKYLELEEEIRNLEF